MKRVANNRFSDAVRDNVAELYKSGLSACQVAKQTGVSESCIYNILKDKCIERRNCAGYRWLLHPDQEQQAVELYNGGMSAKDVAAKFSCCLQTVLSCVKRHGCVIRGAGATFQDISPDILSDMVAMHKAGASMSEIHRKYGFTYKLVSHALKLCGHNTQRQAARREKHGCWKGGRSVHRSSGYVSVRLSPDDPFYAMANSNGSVMEHRIVMARHLGRCLLPVETVHHIDGDRSNNQIENLQLRAGKHGNGQRFCCLDCGSERIGPCEI